MSHAIRNSLILLIVLILFVGGSWGYIEYYQVPEIERLTEEVEQKQQELQTNQEIANQFSAISASYEEASAFFNNYDKALYRDSNEDNVYDFINSLNQGSSYVNFNFAFQDSTIEERYGVLNMQISGDGRYRNLVNFVRRIELSKPLNKVENVSITPIVTEENEFSNVEFSFNLESYYDRTKILEEPSYYINNVSYSSLHNPFFPLVRDIQPNEEGLVNINQSRLVALSTNRVFIVDQNGVMQQLSVGDEVYLGQLTSINLNNRTATFTLNEGGIVRTVTLEVNNEN